MAGDHIEELEEKYTKKILKKVEKQHGPLKTLVWRSGMSAIMVLNELVDVPFELLSTSLYFISTDLNVKELTRKYEAVLELAGASPDKFVDSLHRDLNSISSFIKDNGLMPELFEMIALCDKLRLTIHRNNPQVIHIMNAYQNVLLQTLEYLRPSKFDFNSSVCGCTTKGEILTVPEYYPNIDRVNYEMAKKVAGEWRQFTSSKEINLAFRKLAIELGYPELRTLTDLELVSNTDRIIANQRASLCTFINEYTYDMVPTPEKAFNGIFLFLAETFLPAVDVLNVMLMLRRRAKTLPTNGILFKFDYMGSEKAIRAIPAEDRISQVFMKETFHNDHIVMLYNITVGENMVLAGYFDTKSQFLSSVLIHSNRLDEEKWMYDKYSALLLYLYATATSKDTESMLQDFSNTVYMAENEDSVDRLKVSVSYFAQGGKPKNHYISSGNLSRVNDERFESIPRAIQGYIRKLPAGQSASEEALQRAEALGFELAPDETYVQPFVRNVLRLKEKE